MPTTVKTKTSSLQNFASGLAISEGTKDCLKETKLPGDTSAGVFPRWKAFIPLQQGDEWCSCPELTRSNTNNPAAGQCLQIEPLDFIASRDEPLEARSPLAPRPLVPIRSQWFARPVCYYIRSLTRPSCEWKTPSNRHKGMERCSIIGRSLLSAAISVSRRPYGYIPPRERTLINRNYRVFRNIETRSKTANDARVQLLALIFELLQFRTKQRNWVRFKGSRPLFSKCLILF